MCKSSITCLQMINNNLTVKFHYLCCFEPLHLYRCRHLQVLSTLFCTVFEMAIYSEFSVMWNDNLSIFFKYCLVPFGKIHVSRGISNPPCARARGDLLWFLWMTLANTPSLLWKLLWEVTNCRVSIFTIPKFAISQSEANSTVLISYDIKSLTWYWSHDVMVTFK